MRNGTILGLAVIVGVGTMVALRSNPPAARSAPAIVTPSPAEEAPVLPPATASGDPLSDNPRIAAYQQVAASIDRKIAVANVVADCGIRDMDWYNSVTRRLEDYRNGPAVAPLMMVMNSAELREAQGFDMQITRQHEQWLRPNGRSDCARIAREPFPYNDAAYDPVAD
jgi:hypothetical protein